MAQHSLHTTLPLPAELIERILQALPPDPTSIQTLCHCRQASAAFLHLASLDSVWQIHYDATWKHGNALVTNDYLAAYRRRFTRDQEATALLTRLTTSCINRLPLFETLSEDLLMDVYDRLEAVRVSLDDFDHWQDLARTDDHWLSRHYWATESRSFILRRYAIRKLREITRMPSAIGFETGLTLLSLFRSGDPLCISKAVDGFAERCRAHVDPFLQQKDLVSAVAAIKHCMEVEGFVSASPDHFHDLENNFVHLVLETKRASLPMSMVWIFTATCRRLGIKASAIGFPTTVIARIDGFQDAPDDSDAFYFDIFHNQHATRDRLEEVLLSANRPRELHSTMLDPAETRDIVLRSARNIYNSLGMVDATHDRESLFEAAYAAGAAMVLLDPLSVGRPLLDLITTTIEVRFPYDAQILLREISTSASPYVVDGSRLQDVADVIERVDKHGAQVKHRDPTKVKHSVGKIFKHKLYHYYGAILDYSSRCDASSEWQRAMNVHALDRGAKQPFYHALIIDGSTRYVAEENIMPFSHISADTILELIRAHPNLGRFFRSADVETGRFLLSADLELQHPS